MSTLGYENNKETKGLNLIPGRVIKLKDNPNKLPHIGWNTVKFSLNHPILKTLKMKKISILYTVLNMLLMMLITHLLQHYNENF